VPEGPDRRLRAEVQVLTTVLLADDDERFRALLRSLLEDDGYEVVADAADAPTALALAEELRPAVVVIDLVLPGASGLSAVAALRTHAHPFAVVVLSSLFDPAVEQEAAELGATYLDKTAGVDALEAAIDAAVLR
jgi:DNA-binding NarL/FixJ family response regulator